MVYSIIANSTPADVIKDVAPRSRRAVVLSGPDKFLRTDLEKILKDKGIKTVIVAGTASNGAVLYTASGAAFRGMNVIVPVDGMSAVEPYADLSTASPSRCAVGLGEDDADQERHDQVLICHYRPEQPRGPALEKGALRSGTAGTSRHDGA